MVRDVGPSRGLRDQVEAWISVDPDHETRVALQALLDADDMQSLGELFGGHLEFGTAGIRGVMGPGPMRMNRVVVRRATAGLMAYLPPGATVVIGHDARKNSDVFALDVARVVAGAGGRAALLPPHAPTPLVAFAVRHLAADAGVMCTASHNPATDNGYKVYSADGAQVVSPVDERIAAAIADIDGVIDLADEFGPRIERLGSDIERAYVRHVSQLVATGPATDIRVVYSPLHGVGARLTLAAFDAAGFDRPDVVSSQRDPDPTFPTVETPNPEDGNAVRLTQAAAERVGADVALIHDPDADRLGVLVPVGGSWRPLTGNEIGLLIADHILNRTTGTDRLVVDTVVSSSALARLAAAHGVHHARTLTGFKWIVRPAIEHPEWRFVFGYEEALGFSVDSYVRDKDGIASALVFAELVATLKATGQSVDDRLAALAREHGLFATASWTLGAEREHQVSDAMARLRGALPSKIGAHTVVSTADFLAGNGLPPTDLVEFSLDSRTRLSIRPSGTEPKLKVYAEVSSLVRDGAAYDAAVQRADAQLRQVRAAVVPMLRALLND